MQSLFRRKPLDVLIAEGGDEAHGLKKTLTAVDLLALGIGAIIGAGIFATLGSATSGGTGAPPAGPGVIVSILLTAVACGFCALCYAEFASLVPIAGSAYTYSYATLGELVAWIIGWDLILEYAVGNIAVAISWAAYFRQLMAGFGVADPGLDGDRLPLDGPRREGRRRVRRRESRRPSRRSPTRRTCTTPPPRHPVVFNLLAVAHHGALITWLLVIGIKESARFNNVMVVLKVADAAVLHRRGRVLRQARRTGTRSSRAACTASGPGASLIFFAYIGFDAISTAAEECRDPGRDMPRGIIGSLAICTVLYVARGARPDGDDPVREARRRRRPARRRARVRQPGLGRGHPGVRRRRRDDGGAPRLPARPAAHPHGDVARRAARPVVREDPPEIPDAARHDDPDGGLRRRSSRRSRTSTRSSSSRTSGRSSRSSSSASGSSSCASGSPIGRASSASRSCPSRRSSGSRCASS